MTDGGYGWRRVRTNPPKFVRNAGFNRIKAVLK
jgi:hypothetical protein